MHKGLINHVRFVLGQSTHWRAFTVSYYMTGIVRVPCRFDLRRYPFADQKCELNLWLDPPKLEPVSFHKHKSSDPNGAVPFHGRRDVGEFSVEATYSKEFDLNRCVALFVEFSPYYGYHFLNSFLTSLLILFISFATFFFRIDDFNERIMVSLTALLVLTALFTQANSTSVYTPYLKLLDIWYAVLIICTFLNVVVNTALNAFKHKLESEIVLKEFDMENIRSRLIKLNYMCFGAIVGGFSLFLLFFTLAGADVI